MYSRMYIEGGMRHSVIATLLLYLVLCWIAPVYSLALNNVKAVTLFKNKTLIFGSSGSFASRSNINTNHAQHQTSLIALSVAHGPRSRILTLRAGFSPLVQDAAVSTMVLGETLIWLKIWTTLATKGVVDSTLTRKIIHSSCVPLFILHWPLYSASASAAYLAASIPLAQMLRLYLAGSRSKADGSIASSDNELVAAVSRTGRKEEALGGPFIYAIVLFVATACFFRSSPVGIVAVSQMAAGDGLADIFGRRYGKIKWPFDAKKSIAGSLAFVVGGFVVSSLSLYWMQYTGCMQMDVLHYLGPLFVISLLSAAVELVPGVDDNISVPVCAAALAYWLLPAP